MVIAATSVIENSRNNRSTMPPMNRMDTNTAASARFIESNVDPTSRAPTMAASNGGFPISTWREMFSSTTIASSTTRPVATMSAMSDRLLRENPHRYMTAKLPTSAMGTAATGMAAARTLARNSSTTRITSATAISRVRSASCSVARMLGDRSLAMLRSTSAGRNARRAGSCSWMASAVLMMFASGWRLMTSSIAGSLLKKPVLNRSSTSSCTRATSERRTAAPSRYRMMSGR